MKSFLNRSLWISFMFFSPVTFIGLFSQNSIPGDFLYPVKLSIEKTGSLIFAFTPVSKANYNTSLTERRFEEAHTLLIKNSSTTGLTTLIEQTSITADSTTKIEDQAQKKEIEKKLIQDIDQYQDKLTQVQQAVNPSYQPTPTQVMQVTEAPTPTPTSAYQNKRLSTPTPSPSKPIVKTDPKTPETSPEIVKNIEETKKRLEEIKRKVRQNKSIQTTDSDNDYGETNNSQKDETEKEEKKWAPKTQEKPFQQKPQSEFSPQ